MEFRPCEIQITDFENAAIVCFVVLLTRVILSYQLNFIIPISKVFIVKILNEFIFLIGFLRLMKICKMHKNVMHAETNSFGFGRTLPLKLALQRLTSAAKEPQIKMMQHSVIILY